MAQTSPMCSIMVASAMGIMVIMDEIMREVSALPMRENTVFSILKGRPSHAASCTLEKSTLPVIAPTT